MGSYFKITVNLPVWATMGQFSLIMPRFFVCFSLKDIILWLGFYDLKKPFFKKTFNDLCEKPTVAEKIYTYVQKMREQFYKWRQKNANGNNSV